MIAPTQGWEVMLVLGRLAVVAAWLAAMYLAFAQGHLRVLTAMFCLGFLGVIASVVYQYDRRSRELNSHESGSK